MNIKSLITIAALIIFSIQGSSLNDLVDAQVNFFIDQLKASPEYEKIVSSGNVEIKFEDEYSLKTKEIIYLKNSQEILINHTSKIKDNLGNEIEFKKLKLRFLDR